MHTQPRIGDILVEEGAIARHTLEALLPQAGVRLGDFLRAHDFIDPQTLARAVARRHGLAYVTLDDTPIISPLFRSRDLPLYQKYHYVPYTRERDSLIIATPEPSEQLRRFAMAHHGCPVRMVVTSARDLAHYFASVAARASSRHAVHALRRKARHLVADRIAVRHQIISFTVTMAAIIAGLAAAPQAFWFMLLVGCNLFYLTSLALKCQLYWHGMRTARHTNHEQQLLQHAAMELPSSRLPVYSILVPLYKESEEVIARLLANLSALDYPKEKLDIKLICEADDSETLFAIKRQRPPHTMEILRVPPSHPRTKPKACNIALQQLRGSFATIYDAEDAPAPNQLRLAVARFAQGGEKLACLQAPLNYYNQDENLLTQMFAIEYASLFQLQLPALAALKCPMPLGGTSNHLRVSALREVGGWDAFNVTEDADLGVRLAYFGYETAMLHSLTLEEAPIGLGAWLRQRTRWIKGYIQTWLVFTRDTRALKQRLGTVGYYGFQFFIGAPALTFLLAPLFWGSCILSLLGFFQHLPLWLQGFCMVSLVGGMASHWLFAKAVVSMQGWQHMRLALLLYPLYWMLHSIAAARALWQLATAPHYWEKTKHGVSRLKGVDSVPSTH